jgi:formylglycine-generating enzyme required for sulfatase activity
VYSGRQELDFGKRLDNWKQLAMYFDIPDDQQKRFKPGDEPYAIWEWLKARNKLAELPEALHYIGREDIVVEILEPPPIPEPASEETWQGSPFPGLRSFNATDAPIFFGRKRETNELLDWLRRERFVAVVGASGSGKSSLVAAGVLPRLHEISSESHWPWVWCKPGEPNDDPFLALAIKVAPGLERHGLTIRSIADRLRASGDLASLAEIFLEGQPVGAELLLFIDQFEELFTLTKPEHHRPFMAMLPRGTQSPRLRMVLILRADFYHRCVENARLAELLRSGSFSLATPDMPALWEMITGPAAVAGLTFEEGLVSRILRDTGSEPGSLSLMAFALARLYDKSTSERQITLSKYHEMGGLHEAIGKHADEVVQRTLNGGSRDALEMASITGSAIPKFRFIREKRRSIWKHKDLEKTDSYSKLLKALEILFSNLVNVNIDGEAFVRRATIDELYRDNAVKSLVLKLSEDSSRLLTCTESTVELAHDALLDKWPMLKDWIEQNRLDMRLWAELAHDVSNWLSPPRDKSLLWKGRRLQEAKKLIKFGPPHLPLPHNITIDDVKRFIKASNKERWKTRVPAIFIGLVFSFMLFAVTMVYIKPALLTRKAIPVDSFDANPFGLYNVLGNVWEWTADCLTSKNTQNNSPTQAVHSFDWCLARGGSWDNHEEWKVRASYRLPLAREHRAPTVGFRVARKVYDGEKPETVVQDCPNQNNCPYPKMMILPAPPEHFKVKAPKNETGPCDGEEPRPEQPEDPIEQFAIGQYEVTVKEWHAFLEDKGKVSAFENGVNGHRPITNINWDQIAREDGDSYVEWLRDKTKKEYRLPSGAEWEYAARGDKTGDKATCRWWDDKELGRGKANCAACGLTWKQFFDWLGLLSIYDRVERFLQKVHTFFHQTY